MDGEARLQFLIENGQVKIQADLGDQVLTLELDERQVTAAFLRRASGWSRAIGGRFQIRRPFKAAPPAS